MRESKLPTTVDVPCGKLNIRDPSADKMHQSDGRGRTCVDGSTCGRNASRAVKTDDGTVEILTCGQHVERAKERAREIGE